jgi:cytidylate kinase
MTAGVVTFSSQIGANGAAIARAVAAKLHYRYYDWEVISQAANESGVSPEVLAVASAEREPGFIERVMRRLLAGAPADELSPPQTGPRLSMLTSDDYRHFVEHVVRELAQSGDAVIVGHAAQAVLRERSGVLKVLLVAPLDRRVKRMASTQGLPEKQVRQTIEQSDRQRQDLFKRAYHMDWLDASVYDVSLNTERVSMDLARDMIVACAREIP